MTEELKPTRETLADLKTGLEEYLKFESLFKDISLEALTACLADNQTDERIRQLFAIGDSPLDITTYKSEGITTSLTKIIYGNTQLTFIHDPNRISEIEAEIEYRPLKQVLTYANPLYSRGGKRVQIFRYPLSVTIPITEDPASEDIKLNATFDPDIDILRIETRPILSGESTTAITKSIEVNGNEIIVLAIKFPNSENYFIVPQNICLEYVLGSLFINTLGDLPLSLDSEDISPRRSFLPIWVVNQDVFDSLDNYD